MRAALAIGDEPRATDATEISDLLTAACSGDARAWRSILDRYAHRVFALAKSRCGSAELAEEITQSVFVTVSTKLRQGEYAERGRFEAWLFRVAMNRVRDEARRARRHARPADPAGFGHIAEPEPRPSEPDDRLEAMREAVGELNGADREIIHLRHQAQMSFRQIAELLDEPLGTLLARHHRALRKLRQIMTSHQDAPGEPGAGTEGSTP